MKKELFLFIAATALSIGTATAGTLDAVKERGVLKCAVNSGFPGFSATDDQGNWKGFDVDFCRAVAAAVLGDATKVQFVPTSAKVRFTVLQSGEVDLVSRNTTWSAGRDTAQGVDFIGTTYYDGQGFVVRKSLGVKSAKELDGASVCLSSGSSTELTLADYFSANNMKYRSVTFGNNVEARKAYANGACDVFSGDQSALAAAVTTFPDPSEHVVLPETVSKEPLTPYVRHGDNQWGDVVRWVRIALIAAEEHGITSKNADKLLKASKNPEVRRILGSQGDVGEKLGLEKDWAYKAITSTGNYGEIFDRNIAPLGLERGLNNLWNKGGLLYTPPFW